MHRWLYHTSPIANADHFSGHTPPAAAECGCMGPLSPWRGGLRSRGLWWGCARLCFVELFWWNHCVCILFVESTTTFYFTPSLPWFHLLSSRLQLFRSPSPYKNKNKIKYPAPSPVLKSVSRATTIQVNDEDEEFYVSFWVWSSSLLINIHLIFPSTYTHYLSGRRRVWGRCAKQIGEFQTSFPLASWTRGRRGIGNN